MCEESKTGVIGSLELGSLLAPAWRVLRWPAAVFFGVPLFIGALWAFKWYVLPVAVPFTIGMWLAMRTLKRHVLVVAPPSLRERTALPVARPVRVIARAKVLRRVRAIPAPQQAIEPTRVIPARPAAVTPAPTPRVR